MAKTTVSSTSAESKTRRAREYETIYILRPSVSAEEADRVAKRLTEVVGALHGKLIKLDSWGWRRLAYPIKGATRGVFVYARYAGFDDLVAELERNLRLLDPVVRYQTVLLNPLVNMDDIQVDPADVELEPLAPSDLEEEITIAQRLGLTERQPNPRTEVPAGEAAEQLAAAEPAASQEAAAAALEDGAAASAEEAPAGDAAQPETRSSEPEARPAEAAEGVSGKEGATGGESPPTGKD